jgi:succinoglycan biosynthesis protein ExoA
MPEHPFVSIIVPCYNEENTIQHLLNSVFMQTYPHEKMEVIISDGISTDGTLQAIQAFQQTNPTLQVRVTINQAKTIPSGLNQALRESRGEIIIRLDAHSMPIPEYVHRCVTALQIGKGDNVGGVWEIHPGANTLIAQAIALAAAHPLGAGDALYRLNAKAGAVDTVPFGSFYKSLIDKIGAFDETLLANEDYEFNTRVRQAGGIVYLDPTIRSVYFSRGSLKKLWIQYWRYGFWKLRMLRRYPNTLRWRQALPPVFVLSLIGLSVLSLWVQVAFYVLILQLFLYFFVLGLAGLKLAIGKKKGYLIFGIPLAIFTMHFAWGAGFLFSGSSKLFYKNG